MANQTDVIEVTLTAGKTVRKHQGNGFHVDERGNLVIAFEKAVVCIYAAEQWCQVETAGNRIREKA